MGPVIPDRLIGTLVDRRYQVGCLLGSRQGMATYRVLQVIPGRQAALVVPELGSGAGLDADRVLAAVKLSHPAAVVPRDLGLLADGRPYLVREWITGRSLRQLAGADADPGTLLAQLEEVAACVAHAHACGCVHGHLTLDQVLVEGAPAGEARPRVLGWGFPAGEGAGSSLGDDQEADLAALRGLVIEALAGPLPRVATERSLRPRRGCSADAIRSRLARADLPERAVSRLVLALSARPGGDQPAAAWIASRIGEARHGLSGPSPTDRPGGEPGPKAEGDLRTQEAALDAAFLVLRAKLWFGQASPALERELFEIENLLALVEVARRARPPSGP